MPLMNNVWLCHEFKMLMEILEMRNIVEESLCDCFLVFSYA